MQNFTWNGVRLRSHTYTVPLGTWQMELTRVFRNGSGTPVILLPDFLESSAIFLAESGGLAPYLASAGFDVYCPDLRGAGNSWPRVNRHAKWGIHDILCEEIPAHLGVIEKLRPGVPQLWLGHGFGGLLLLGAYAQIDRLAAPVVGIVQVATVRKLMPSGLLNAMRFKTGCIFSRIKSVLQGYAGSPFSSEQKRATRATAQARYQWMTGLSWTSPANGADIAQRLIEKGVPPSLYLATKPGSLRGSTGDCRALISELGGHDVRLMEVSKRGGNKRNYTANALITSQLAVKDHFETIMDWLKEQERLATQGSAEQMKLAAEELEPLLTPMQAENAALVAEI